MYAHNVANHSIPSVVSQLTSLFTLELNFLSVKNVKSRSVGQEVSRPTPLSLVVYFQLK